MEQWFWVTVYDTSCSRLASLFYDDIDNRSQLFEVSNFTLCFPQLFWFWEQTNWFSCANFACQQNECNISCPVREYRFHETSPRRLLPWVQIPVTYTIMLYQLGKVTVWCIYRLRLTSTLWTCCPSLVKCPMSRLHDSADAFFIICCSRKVFPS